MDIMKALQGLVEKKAVRTVSMAIPCDIADANDQTVSSAVAKANEAYFQIRLCEMFLVHQKKFGMEYIPSAFFLTDFHYGSALVHVPFFVNNALIDGIDKAASGLDKTAIRFRNTRIMGPVPYRGGEVGIFVGLFRTKVGDLRKSLFSVFDKLFGTVDIANLRQIISIADKLTDELLKCFGLQDVQCLLAERNVYGISGSPGRPLRDGYFVLINADPSQVDARALRVIDDALYQQQGDTTRPYDAFDYCLVRLEHFPFRDDYTTLSFHKTWEQVRKELVASHEAEARMRLIECYQQILESQDLTELHKTELVVHYEALFQRDRSFYSTISRSTGAETGTRGSRGEASGSAVLNLVTLREQASQRKASHHGIEGIDAIRSLFERRPQVIDALNDDINQSLRLLQASNATPAISAETLVQALAKGVFA